MNWLGAIGLTALGLALLGGGGELLVRGAVALAKQWGVAPALIGLTIVALGTSLPELVVSLLAASHGQADIAVGNVIGSNIMNIAFVLGLAAVLVPLPIHGTAVRLEWPFMFVASCVFVLLARDGSIDRLEGGFFLVCLVMFTIYMVTISRTTVTGEEAAEFASLSAHRGFGGRVRSAGVPLGAVSAGAVLLLLGGKALIDGAVQLATLAGLTERVIALTIIAAGTSAPEVVTSVIAALRRHTDVAIANVIGSNIFNILGIMGVTGLVTTVPVSAAMVRGDVWWMLGTSFVLLPLMRIRFNLSRFEGCVLLTAYAAYLVVLFRT